MRIVVLPLSITSSWGNGHATNYRALGRALAARGHDLTFLERDVPWYAAERDLREIPYGTVHLYNSIAELTQRHGESVAHADLVIVGSFVPEGVAVCEWILGHARGLKAFYDIDTPVTLEKLRNGDYEYLAPQLIPGFDLYLSFTGGPVLEVLRTQYGARNPHAFYCVVDASEYRPEEQEVRWDLGYLGTFSADRKPVLDALLIGAAERSPEKRFCVAGPNHPQDGWPTNIERIDHLPPGRHRAFYGAQRFTLNATREQMASAGYSPSVRLFEAAACGVPIISDSWPGLDEIFVVDEEILIACNSDEVLSHLSDIDEERRRAIAAKARNRVIAEHTAEQRVRQLENHLVALQEVSDASW